MQFDKASIYFVFAITYSAVIVESYKFLAILPTTFRSHFIYGATLMEALAQKGHTVYVISPYPRNEELKNYYDVPFSYDIPLPADYKIVNAGDMENAYKIVINNHESLIPYAIFKSAYVEQLMKGNHKFDAVICEDFYSEALFGFSEHFKAPLIALSPLAHAPWNTDMIGSPSPPSYVPFSMTSFSDHMIHVERLVNLKLSIIGQLTLHYDSLPRQALLYKKFFPHLKRDMYTVRKNAAAVLLNTHVSLGYPRPSVPNQISVGGLHINRHRNFLPEDLEKFINEAKHGVIYFSMGTNIVSRNSLALKTLDLFSAFRQLKQRVIWKLDDPFLEGKHYNILIRQWFPQEDILAHANVKVFITQGGLLSFTESVYHAKPIIGIPVISDQFYNTGKANIEGMGIILDYLTINASHIVSSVEKVIYNKSYTERAKEMSARYRDQPILPLDLAVYWVEHVAREKGAKYLHCAGLDLKFFQYHNLDAALVLYGCLLTALLFIFYLSYLLLLC